MTAIKPPSRHCFAAPNPHDEEGTHEMVWWEWGNPEGFPLVCVHGLTRNGRDFEFLAQALASQYRIIAPDIAGRGESAILEDYEWYDNATYLNDLVALLDHLGLEKVDWVGTSMGGIIGMMMASFLPARIRRLVLNDVGAMLPKAGLERIATYVGRKQTFASRTEAEHYLRQVMAPFGVRQEHHWTYLFDHSFRPAENGSWAFTYDPRIGDCFRVKAERMGGVQDVEIWMLWDAIKAPVLLLRGAVSDILPREVAMEMCKRHPDCTLVEFAGIGHAPMLMEDDQIHAITRWLEATPVI